MYLRKKKYRPFIVTVYNMDDLESLYEDLEIEGKTPQNISILRPVECVNRRPISRSTHYLLTNKEATLLQKDPRVRSVELEPEYRGLIPKSYNIIQESDHFDKSNNLSPEMINWALLRCYEEQNRSGWGMNPNDGTNSSPLYKDKVSGTVILTQTGKNVDVVIVDDNGIVWDHPEFTDSQGNTRTVQYNWGQHNEEIGIGPNTESWSYGEPQIHSTHVAGTVAGKTQGWARDANIYNIGFPDIPLSVIDYVRAFHNNKPVNPSTGRKNPTIVNNSWGYSWPVSLWDYKEITAVTYRGTRYVPEGETFRAREYGIEYFGSRYGNFVNFENGGNRIILTESPGENGYSNSTPVILNFDEEVFNNSSPSSQSPYGFAIFQPISDLSEEPFWFTEVEVQGSGPIQIRFEFSVSPALGSQRSNHWYAKLKNKIKILDENQNIIKEFSYEDVKSGMDVIFDDVWCGGRVTFYLENNSNHTIRFERLIETTPDNPNQVTWDYIIEVQPYIFTIPMAEVTSIPLNLLGPANLTSQTEVSPSPVPGDNDYGYWNINLPFDVYFNFELQNQITITTDGLLQFGGLYGDGIYFAYENLFTTNFSNLRSTQRIYSGAEGTAPNRTFRIRIEATTAEEGILGSPDLVYEITFYENTPNQIDWHVGENSDKIVGGLFDFEQLREWGLQQLYSIPGRVNALDSDIEAAIQDGIIFVGAAGNSAWRIDSPGGLDYNNSIEMAEWFPGSVNDPIFYMRGSSPTAVDSVQDGGNFNLSSICVGSIDPVAQDRKASYSNCGPGVDIYAPGTLIISSTPIAYDAFGNVVSVLYPGSSEFWLLKMVGTSMASPQVCGVLACALEVYPNMTQIEAKNYIRSYAKLGQLYDSTIGPSDLNSLQGSNNLFLYYHKERFTEGNVFPKINYRYRKSSGFVYPRVKIRRK